MNADQIIKSILGILVALLAFLGVDTLKRIRKLEEEAVRKAEIETIRAQLTREHTENGDRLSVIESGLEGGLERVHSRIDELFKFLVNRNAP